MRTTINLPDDVLRVARSLAEIERISLGDAVGQLARAGFQPAIRVNAKKAFPSFELKEGASPITLEQTLAVEDEL